MMFDLGLALAILLGLATMLTGATAIGARMIERRHPPAGSFVAVSGGRLHVVALGPLSAAGAADVPVVLLHGASGNLEDMRLALGEPLSRRRRVILVDRPGHGWSERSRGPRVPEPARQAALILEALDRIGVGRAIFVGHSWSGALVLALALARPERVAGVVLLAPVTHPWRRGVSWYYDAAVMPVVGKLLVRTLVLPVGALVLRPGSRRVFAPQLPPHAYVARAAIALSLRPAHFLANARDVVGLKAAVTAQAPRYHEITAPMAIITGDRDETVSPSIHSQALARTLAAAKLIVLPGVGHMPHHVARDIVIAEIDRLAATTTDGTARTVAPAS